MEAVNLRVVCAWCPMFGRPAAVLQEGDPGAMVSHAQCPDCQAELNRQLDALEREKKP